MAFTAIVLFRGSLAHYSVTIENDGTYVAALQKYSGKTGTLPPSAIVFKKQGRHCMGNCGEQDLMDDIYEAVQSKSKKYGGSTGIIPGQKVPYTHT